MSDKIQRFVVDPTPQYNRKKVDQLANMVGINTNNGNEMLKFVLELFRNEHEDIVVTTGQRIWAMEWLADRYFGKAAQVVETITDAKPNVIDANFDTMSDADLERLEEAGNIIEANKKL